MYKYVIYCPPLVTGLQRPISKSLIFGFREPRNVTFKQRPNLISLIPKRCMGKRKRK